MLLFNEISLNLAVVGLAHFNTSNVTIQPVACTTMYTHLQYFNTSNVTIQQNITAQYGEAA